MNLVWRKETKKELTTKEKVVFSLAAAVFSLILGFFFTMIVFPDAVEPNKVFWAVSGLTFLIVNCITKGEVL